MQLPFSELLHLTGSLLPLDLSSFWRTSSPSGVGVTPLPPAEFDKLVPYMELARAAYCEPDIITGWQCGGACRAVPDFEPTLTGGDGAGTQYYFVGFWPTQSAVVVAHQGTDPLQILADFIDLNTNPMKLDPILFPNVPNDIRVHSGFAIEHKITAPLILAEVKNLMANHSSTNVILIGHSLGGALAELDTLFMKLHLPTTTKIQGVTFGTPRVGNPAWATFFDSEVADFKRVNNKLDPIPTLPWRTLDFMHPSGEIHIGLDGIAVACPGPDNDVDPECSDLQVPDALEGNILDHLGPYHDGANHGIYIGSIFCTA